MSGTLKVPWSRIASITAKHENMRSKVCPRDTMTPNSKPTPSSMALTFDLFFKFAYSYPVSLGLYQKTNMEYITLVVQGIESSLGLF